MISRQLVGTLRRLVAAYPIIAITGPRQSGKTTLARALFADRPYVSLEDPAERAFALEDPKGFLARFTQGAVFDDAQRWPDLFSWLQGMVDAERVPGRFVLTGSQQFGLLAGISQSLAGRVGLAHLLPLSIGELAARPQPLPRLDELTLAGAYPAIHAHGIPPGDWMAAYVATYLERDVRRIANIQDLPAFQRFVRLCAGRTGQLLNLSALGGEAGVAHGTARAWLGVLEASYLVHVLPPYHRNFGKRLVKTPKLYFLDVGLAAWLLGIRDSATLALHPLRGALFETLIVSEVLKHRRNLGLPADIYFWRDNNGLEADLLIEDGAKLQPVEIKSGQTVTQDYIRAAQRAGRIPGEEGRMPWLVFGGDERYERSGVRVIGWRELPAALSGDVPTTGIGTQ
jgi:predicted AAA+ superfamily ATPase